MSKIVEVLAFIRLLVGAALLDFSLWCREFAQ